SFRTVIPLQRQDASRVLLCEPAAAGFYPRRVKWDSSAGRRGTLETVVYGGGGDRGLAHRHADLIERRDDVPYRVQAGNVRLLVGIDEDGARVVDGAAEAPGELGTIHGAERRIERIEFECAAVAQLNRYDSLFVRVHTRDRGFDDRDAKLGELRLLRNRKIGGSSQRDYRDAARVVAQEPRFAKHVRSGTDD